MNLHSHLPCPPLGVLGAVFALQSGLALAAAIVPAPGITPGLAARYLGLNNLLKKSWDASCSVVLDGLPSIGSVDVGAPARLPGVLPPSISAEAWTVGSEYDDEPKAQRDPQWALRGVRKIPPSCGRGVLVVVPHEGCLFWRRVVGR